MQHLTEIMTARIQPRSSAPSHKPRSLQSRPSKVFRFGLHDSLLFDQVLDGRIGPLLRVHSTDVRGRLLKAAERESSRAVVRAIPKLSEAVARVAQVPGDVALTKGEEGVGEFWVFDLEDGDDLLRVDDAVARELIEGLVEGGAVAAGVVVDQGGLVAGLVELLVEGHEVVDEDHPVLHLGDHGRDLGEELLFVELRAGEHGRADAVAQAIEAA